MRIPSGVTDQYIYFVAVDATDFATRETGLSSFTVYRSRNGGAAAAMTTPTINETDTTNMPGVYELLLDEDMSIDAGDDSQEMCFHITHAGMAPVTRTIELYRPKLTVGNTLDVTATGAAGIDWGNVENQSTSVDLSATDIQLCDTVTTLTGHTAQTGDNFARIGAAGAGLTAVPWNSAWDAEVQSECNDALVAVHLDHLLAVDYDPAAKPGVATALLNELVENNGGVSRFTAPALAQAPTGGGGGLTAQDLLDIADQVWDEALTDHLDTGSTGNALNAAGAAGDPWSTSLPGAYGAGTAGNIVGNNLDAAVSTTATAAALATVGGNVDAILLDTGTDGVVISAMTANQIADALLNRDMSAVSDTNARSPLNALRFLRNKYSVVGTTLTVTKEDDSTTAWTASLTVDATADPITGSDPT